MSDNCPTCGSPVRVECSGVTGYFVPLNLDSRVKALELRLHRLEMARKKLINLINSTPTDNPVRVGMCQALEIISENRN